MHHRLRVHDDVDSVGGHRKQVKGLYQLQALVHHGGAIDADFCAHVPIGVSYGFGGRHFLHFRQGLTQERPARRGERDLGHAVGAFEIKDLENGAVLGIHRNQGRPALFDLLGHKITGTDQGFLVGQRHQGAAPGGF